MGQLHISLGIHQQHVSIAQIGIVDTRIAGGNLGVGTGGVPDLRPLQVVQRIGSAQDGSALIVVVPEALANIFAAVALLEAVAVERLQVGTAVALTPGEVGLAGIRTELRALTIANGAGSLDGAGLCPSARDLPRCK